MKIYICIILLCGMSKMNVMADTKVPGGCLFGKEILRIGEHSVRPCMKAICNRNGQLTFFSCPLISCHPDQKQVGWQEEADGIQYPYCCPQPICVDPPSNPTNISPYPVFLEINYE